MTESEAWRLIASHFAVGDFDGSVGICAQITSAGRTGHVGYQEFERMRSRLDTYMEGIWAYPHPSVHEWPQETFQREREWRCLACLWLACEAESEGL